jgi:hypothetical protein
MSAEQRVDEFFVAFFLLAMVVIWSDELLWLARKAARKAIPALAFVSRPLVWVGKWLNERADAKTARLWRTCPKCGHDAGRSWRDDEWYCGCHRACGCYSHGKYAWYQRSTPSVTTIFRVLR